MDIFAYELIVAEHDNCKPRNIRASKMDVYTDAYFPDDFSNRKKRAKTTEFDKATFILNKFFTFANS